MSDADAWTPDPPDGADLLDDVRAFVCRFVSFPSPAAATAAALWAGHAHLVLDSDNSPRLALLSPEPGSGKTRTLEVLELLTPQPMHVLSASPAAIFRTLDAEQPTLLMDEVDSIFGRRGNGDDGSEDLRALLNAGHRKGATIPRCVGPRHDVVRFGVFAAVAMAGLGDLPDTLMSRSVIIRMRRRAPAERIEPFRRRLHELDGENLRARLDEWTRLVRFDVADAWPDMPAGVEDRPADVWEPLLAIADAAGGHWPETARAACVELCKVAESREASLGVRLLGDLRAVFRDAGDPEGLPTSVILERLHKLAEAPWADLRGKPLDARGLARRLTMYEVGSVNIKVTADQVLKGYRREHLWDAWTRYLPSHPPTSATSATSATPSTIPAGQPAIPEVAEHASAIRSVADTNATDTAAATARTASDLHRYPGSGGSGPTGMGAREGDALTLDDVLAGEPTHACRDCGTPLYSPGLVRCVDCAAAVVAKARATA